MRARRPIPALLLLLLVVRSALGCSLPLGSPSTLPAAVSVERVTVLPTSAVASTATPKNRPAPTLEASLLEDETEPETHGVATKVVPTVRALTPTALPLAPRPLGFLLRPHPQFRFLGSPCLFLFSGVLTAAAISPISWSSPRAINRSTLSLHSIARCLPFRHRICAVAGQDGGTSLCSGCAGWRADAVGDDSGDVTLLDVQGQKLWRHSLSSRVTALASGKASLVVGGWDELLTLLDAAGTKPVVRWQVDMGSPISSITTLPDRVLTATLDGRVHAYDLTGAEVGHFEMDVPITRLDTMSLKTQGQVADGALVLAGGQDGRLLALDSGGKDSGSNGSARWARADPCGPWPIWVVRARRLSWGQAEQPRPWACSLPRVIRFGVLLCHQPLGPWPPWTWMATASRRSWPGWPMGKSRSLIGKVGCVPRLTPACR